MRARARIRLAAGLATLVAALSPAVATAATIPVNSNADSTTDDQLCTLREATLAATNNAAQNPAGGVDCPAGQAGPATDTIAIGNLPAAEPDVITLGSALLVGVSAGQGPVIIDGRGPAQTVVDANDTGRVFSPSGDTSVTLRDLTATNGTVANGNGGGIRSSAADLTFDNVTVSNNTLTGNAGLAFGAGISIGSGTLTVIDSTISGNSVSGSLATVRGGGIHMTGEGGATIDRTTISGNTLTNTNATQQVRGGGLMVDEADANVTITNSTFSSNTLSGGTLHLGGGIDWAETDSNGPRLELENTTFSGNSVGASGHGGAIYTNGDAIISHTTIGPNTGLIGAGLFVSTTGVEIRNSLVETGTTADCGGAERPVSQGYNIERGPSDDCQFSDPTDQLPDQALMAGLAANGGPTQTHEIAFDFIDLIPVANCFGADGAALMQDQRGAPRQFDDGILDTGPNCDPGAYERAECNGEPAEVIGTPGADTLTGTPGTEIILGLGGADVILPGAGSDRVCAGDGDDTLAGGDDDVASDSYDGGNGSDTYDLTDFGAGATVNLATGDVQPSDPLGNEFISSLENVIGGDGGDTLTGDAGPNRLDGASGNDIITGAGGSDQLLGNFGNLDALFARDGVSDLVDCGVGTGDTAQTDRLSLDSVTGCEGVDALPEPPAVTPITPITPITPTTPTAGVNPECATLRAKLKRAKSKRKKKKIRAQLRKLGC